MGVQPNAFPHGQPHRQSLSISILISNGILQDPTVHHQQWAVVFDGYLAKYGRESEKIVHSVEWENIVRVQIHLQMKKID